MNNDNIKIKYLIGSFREDPSYPSVEDFEFLMSNWFYNEGGLHFMHTNRNIEETDKVCFTDNILVEKLNGDEIVAKTLISNLLSEGRITLLKKTRFTSYYELTISNISFI